MSRLGLSALAERRAPVHLMGIGGAGMAGLALLLQARGARVSGCDKASSVAVDELRERGVAVHEGHHPGHADESAVLIHTAAIPADHAELAAARSRGLPVLKRSEALADLVNPARLIAVSGTHGKTTTTALVTLALEAAGLDPTALVGGRVSGWSGNARIGDRHLCVVEADEYDRAFLALRPWAAVVTSVEAEHLDIYASLSELEAAFERFVSYVPEDGVVLACGDDPGAARCLRGVAVGETISYGMGENVDLRAESVRFDPAGASFEAFWKGERLADYRLGLHGAHNVRNALAALGVVLAMGRDPVAAADAFRDFRGVDRRFQVMGERRGVTIVDDYAHHPTEVAATLAAARAVYPGRRLVAAFQPHLYSRTRAFGERLGRELARADVVYVSDVYPAREERIPGVSGELVANAAKAAAPAVSVRYFETLAELTEKISEALRSGDVLITIGAGDVNEVARNVLLRLGGDDVVA